MRKMAENKHKSVFSLLPFYVTLPKKIDPCWGVGTICDGDGTRKKKINKM